MRDQKYCIIAILAKSQRCSRIHRVFYREKLEFYLWIFRNEKNPFQERDNTVYMYSRQWRGGEGRWEIKRTRWLVGDDGFNRRGRTVQLCSTTTCGGLGLTANRPSCVVGGLVHTGCAGASLVTVCQVARLMGGRVPAPGPSQRAIRKIYIFFDKFNLIGNAHAGQGARNHISARGMPAGGRGRGQRWTNVWPGGRPRIGRT